MALGILAIGGYLPKARLQRTDIANANAWFNPALKGLAKGERTMANWDEDSVTMAVEAGRDCLTGIDRNIVAGIYMASTSFPFQDRQNAGIVADALNLSTRIQTLDISSSQRAGSSALLTALQSIHSAEGPILVSASEKRRTRAASPLELTTGDGAAAVLVGEGEPIARYIGGHTEAVDFVDHFRGEGETFDYSWEERWVRDEGYMKIAPNAINNLLDKVGVSAQDIDRFAERPRVLHARLELQKTPWRITYKAVAARPVVPILWCYWCTPWSRPNRVRKFWSQVLARAAMFCCLKPPRQSRQQVIAWPSVDILLTVEQRIDIHAIFHSTTC